MYLEAVPVESTFSNVGQFTRYLQKGHKQVHFVNCSLFTVVDLLFNQKIFIPPQESFIHPGTLSI